MSEKRISELPKEIDNYCEHDPSSELIEQLIQMHILSKL